MSELDFSCDDPMRIRGVFMALPPYTKGKEEGQPIVAEAMEPPPTKRESSGTCQSRPTGTPTSTRAKGVF
jgi:hypothetical protein